MTNHCIFCGSPLKFWYTSIGTNNDYFKCGFHNMIYSHNNDDWSYLENRIGEEHYGKWIGCTKRINMGRKEKVLFT